ncbi:hypothetical protein [Paraburkholderia hospita]|uniref:hypothetical protein n=1 Tax=Paraburkholderia hospita TaxID=169430 RepID=UPI000B348770|nr:hypothetical protein [Paraburkholderia hospita]OUL95666.1 hypothetical protein CA603_07575 [Paraburkholderia hospita]
MNREPIAPFELCRAELTGPVRLTRLAEDWRRDLNALDGRRIKRDRDAMRRLEAALTQSDDLCRFTAAVQAASQDYTNETLAIWGEGISLTAQHQAEWLAELDGVFGAWRMLWHAPLQKLPGIDAPVGSFSAWLRACQDTVRHASGLPRIERESPAASSVISDTTKRG